MPILFSEKKQKKREKQKSSIVVCIINPEYGKV